MKIYALKDDYKWVEAELISKKRNWLFDYIYLFRDVLSGDIFESTEFYIVKE